jgi:hypothetical protein
MLVDSFGLAKLKACEDQAAKFSAEFIRAVGAFQRPVKMSDKLQFVA